MATAWSTGSAVDRIGDANRPAVEPRRRSRRGARRRPRHRTRHRAPRPDRRAPTSAPRDRARRRCSTTRDGAARRRRMRIARPNSWTGRRSTAGGAVSSISSITTPRRSKAAARRRSTAGRGSPTVAASMRIRSHPLQSDGGSQPSATTTLRPSRCGPRPSGYAAPASRAVWPPACCTGRAVALIEMCLANLLAALLAALPALSDLAGGRVRTAAVHTGDGHHAGITAATLPKGRAPRLCARVHPRETRSTHRSRILVSWISSPMPCPARSRVSASRPLIIRVSMAASSGSPTRSRTEPRYFGRLDGTGPKPFPSLIARVCSRESGFRIAALHEGRVVGLARVDDAGEVFVVVVADARGRGVGLALARALIDRARAHGCRRLVLRSSRRSRAAVALAESMGFVVVDLGRGRIELILDLVQAA